MMPVPLDSTIVAQNRDIIDDLQSINKIPVTLPHRTYVNAVFFTE